MRSRRWIRFLLGAMALLLAASWGVSGALRYGWARRSLLSKLSASFGRPVEAQRFTFSLFSGPHLEAQSVTVSEDPHFGQEYFLRADRLTAGLRWGALLRGRIEFGTVSLTRPSLNLVHASDGHWNVESWLPPVKASSPRGAGAAEPAPAPVAKHLGRIQVDGGRINFKLGAEKLLFALVGVSGHLDQDGAGRWSLDLRANPMRASVALQEAGTLWLRGTVAGTSARLRPAALLLSWQQASLADVLRLASGRDMGVRGMLGAELSARIEDVLPEAVGQGSDPGADNQWKFAGTLRLAGMHRWDLPARPADPAVNLTVTAAWRPGTAHLEMDRCMMESANSQLRALGDLDWSHGFSPSLEIISSSIGLGDLLAWPRSFRPGLPDELALDGSIGLQAKLVGWPPRIEQANVDSRGAVVRLGGIAGPIRIGPVLAGMQRNLVTLNPVSVSLPASPAVAPARARPPNVPEVPPALAGILHVEGALGPLLPGKGPRDWPYRIAVSGQTARTQDLVMVARAFGWPVATDWKVEGPAALNLAWAGVPRRGALPVLRTLTGSLELRGLRWTSVVLNQPVLFSAATIELLADQRRVKLADAEALGAHWKGTLDWRAAERVWHFDLLTDRLETADLDRWLGPRARAGFLERMLPFAVASSLPPPRDAAIERLVARGRLRIGELSLAPLHFERVEAAIELNGRNLALRHAQAGFYNGRVVGDFEATLSADPAYTFRGQFDRVNLAALTLSNGWPEGRFAGLASGEMVLAAHGIGRGNLLGSLAGQGGLRVREPVLRGLDLASVATGTSSESRFANATGDFHIERGQVLVDQLLLAAREERFEMQGSVGSARKLDLRVRPLPRVADAAPDSNSGSAHEELAIGGTLDAPLLTRQTRIAGNSAPAPGPVLRRR